MVQIYWLDNFFKTTPSSFYSDQNDIELLREIKNFALPFEKK